MFSCVKSACIKDLSGLHREGGRVRDGRARGEKQRRSRDANPYAGNRQVNQEEYDSGDEAVAFPINFNGEIACEDNVILMVKIDNTATSRLIDCGAQSPVLGKEQLDNLVRDGLTVKLRSENRNLRLYENG